MSISKLLPIAVAALAVAAAAPPAASAAVVRENEGTVASVDRDSRTFRLRDSSAEPSGSG
jgi:hypothetical protein